MCKRRGGKQVALSYLDLWISRKTSEKDLVAARFFVVLFHISLLLTALGGLLVYGAGLLPPDLGTILSVVFVVNLGMLSCLPLGVNLRHLARFNLAWILSVLTFLAFFFEGPGLAFSVWTTVVPIYAVLLTGPREGTFWTCLSCVSVIFFYLITGDPAGTTMLDASLLLNATVFPLCILALICYYHRQRSEAVQEISDLQHQLVRDAKWRALGEMANGVAHEINNPLAIIGGHLDIVRGLSRGGDPQMAKSFQSIETAVGRITAIVQSLQTYTDTDPSAVGQVEDLAKVLEKSLQLCHESLQSEGITIRMDIGEQAIPVKCTEAELMRVFVNLLNNSRDAAKSSKDKWIRIQVETTDYWVSVRVSDSGSVLDEEKAGNIFHPFVTTKNPGEGTGLGLTESLWILRRLNGSLVLEKGTEHTTFKVTLQKAA